MLKVSPKKKKKEIALTLSQLMIMNGLTACGGGGDNSAKEPDLNLINGTNNADYIRGTVNGDLIYAMSGNDRILSFGGDDTIYPGSGSNTVFAGDGDDTIIVSSFSQDIDGGDGVDTLKLAGSLQFANVEVDFINGTLTSPSPTNDLTTQFTNVEGVEAPGSSNVNLIGSPTTSYVLTGSGDDSVSINSPEASISLGGGSDVITVVNSEVDLHLGPGDDYSDIYDTFGAITGGEGTDTITIHLSDLVSDGFQVDLLNGNFKSGNGLQSSTISDFENVYVNSSNAVKLVANELTNIISGGDGDDHLIAAGTSNVLTGNGGADTFEVNSEFAGILAPAVSDFNAGEGDIIKFSNMDKTKSDDGNVSITFANLSLGGVKDIANDTHIIVCSSGIGFVSESEFLQKLNGTHGIAENTSDDQLNEAYLCLWHNSTENSAYATRVEFSDADNQYLSNGNIVKLFGLAEENLATLATENFIIT